MHTADYTVLILFLLRVLPAKGENHHIAKRTLLFPEFTTLQFTYGVTAPLLLPKRSINLSLCVQINYQLPFNTSQLVPDPISAKSMEDYDLDRHTFYQYVVGVLDGIGLNGEQCLLRSICEVAEIPMHIQESNSLLENIVHFLLTPSEDYVYPLNYLHNSSYSLNDNTIEAEFVGKTTGQCHEEFSACPVSIVDLFTKLHYI